MSEPTKITIDDMTQYVLAKNAEIERLKQRIFQLEAIIEFGAHSTLEQYWSLMRRAADLLSLMRSRSQIDLSDWDLRSGDLIAELRKAAE